MSKRKFALSFLFAACLVALGFIYNGSSSPSIKLADGNPPTPMVVTPNDGNPPTAM